MSLYETLGVEESATSEEIKKAYRAKAKAEHPDGGGDAERFNQIVRAYDVLKDDDARKEYDETGRVRSGSPEDRTTDAARGILATLVAQAAAQENAIRHDIIKTMRESLHKARKEAADQLPQAEKDIKRLGDMLDRLKGEGILRSLFEQRKQSTHGVVAHIEQKQAEIDRALELLEGYSFDPEEEEPETLTGWPSAEARFPYPGASFFGFNNTAR